MIIGIYKNFEIGVDIEWIDYNFPYEEIIKDTLASEEVKDHNIMGENEKLKNFYFHWTIKESITKATGKGLKEYFNKIVIGRDSGSIQLLSYPKLDDIPQNITLKSMVFKEKYMLSLTVFDSLTTIKFYNENEIN